MFRCFIFFITVLVSKTTSTHSIKIYSYDDCAPALAFLKNLPKNVSGQNSNINFAMIIYVYIRVAPNGRFLRTLSKNVRPRLSWASVLSKKVTLGQIRHVLSDDTLLEVRLPYVMFLYCFNLNAIKSETLVFNNLQLFF